MNEDLIERCYLCGAIVRSYPLRTGEKPGADFRTRDHVPPIGLFPDPKPADLITVPCCFKCNNEHSGFDERLRIVASMPFDRNAAGERIVDGKVIGGTLAKGRQMKFAGQLLGSMRPVPGDPELVGLSMDAKEFKDGAIRITKGLLAAFHKQFDYFGSFFHAEVISPEPFDAQLHLIAALKRAKHFERGQRVFQCWRFVDEAQGDGFWMLLFYECFGFFVRHTTNSERFRQWEHPHS
jgi:hypothetical protein